MFNPVNQTLTTKYLLPAACCESIGVMSTKRCLRAYSFNLCSMFSYFYSFLYLALFFFFFFAPFFPNSSSSDKSARSFTFFSSFSSSSSFFCGLTLPQSQTSPSLDTSPLQRPPQTISLRYFRFVSCTSLMLMLSSSNVNSSGKSILIGALMDYSFG